MFCVFIETNVLRSYLEYKVLDQYGHRHPNGVLASQLIQKVVINNRGVLTSYVVDEATHSFTYDLTERKKFRLPIDTFERILFEYKRFIAELMDHCNFYDLWVKEKRLISPLKNQISDWWDNIHYLDIIEILQRDDLIRKGIEHSDRIILAEALHIQNNKLEALDLVFSTYDTVILKFRDHFKDTFLLDISHPRPLLSRFK